jgi:hypothetical protein
MSPVDPEGLTEASERLIRDWDQHPDAIDANELSARLWLIEKEARRAALATSPAPLDVERLSIWLAARRIADDLRDPFDTKHDDWNAALDAVKRVIDTRLAAIAREYAQFEEAKPYVSTATLDTWDRHGRPEGER